MTSSLARNAVANVAQMFIGAGLLFILYRYINDTLGAAALGVWSVVLATASASRLADLGLSASVTRFVARYLARNEQQTAARIVETAALSVALLLLLALPILYWVLWWGLSYFFDDGYLTEARIILPYALVSLWLSILSAVFLSGLDGCQRMDLRAGLGIVGQLLMVVLAFLLIPSDRLVGLALAQIGQGAFLLVAGCWVLRGRLHALPRIPLHWSKPLFREMLGYGTQLQAAGLFMLLFDPLTKAMMARFGGPAAAGYFEMANQVVIKVRALIVAANQAVIPKVAEMAEATPEKLPFLYRANLRLLILVALPVFALLFGWSGLVAWLLVGEAHPELVFLLQLNAVAWLLNIFSGPAYFTNLGAGWVGWNTLSHISMGLLNVIFGWILGQWFGAYGVAWAYGMSLVGGSLVLVIAFHRRLGVQISDFVWKEHGWLAATSVLLSGIGFCAWRATPNERVLWVVATVALSLTLVFVAWRHPLREGVFARLASLPLLGRK